jgi:hypothetical protein
LDSGTHRRIPESLIGATMQRSGQLPLFAWRDAVRSDLGPSKSTTRQVLIELSLWMNNDKLLAWPSEETIAERCALSSRCVRTHLKLAEEQGWISRKLFRPAGKQQSQYCYTGTFAHGHPRPEGRSGIHAQIPESDAPRPESDDQDHRNQVPPNSQENSQENSASSEGHQGRGREDFHKLAVRMTGKIECQQ